LFRLSASAEERLGLKWVYIRVLKIAFLLLMFIHWQACFLYLQAVLHNFSPGTWVARNGLQHASLGTLYSLCMMSVMAEVSTCGYAVYPAGGPTVLSEQVLMIISFFLGTLSFINYTGAFLSVTMSHNPSTTSFSAYMHDMGAYLKSQGLEFEIRARVREFYNKRFDRHLFDEEAIVSNLPVPVQRTLSSISAAAVVASVPLFRDADPGCLHSILDRLKNTLFLADDEAVKEGEPPSSVFFVASGRLRFSRAGVKMTRLSSGDYFGETAVLHQIVEPCTVTALVDSVCFYLTAEDFATLLEGFPTELEVFKRTAAARLANWGTAAPPAAGGPAPPNASRALTVV